MGAVFVCRGSWSHKGEQKENDGSGNNIYFNRHADEVEYGVTDVFGLVISAVVSETTGMNL